MGLYVLAGQRGVSHVMLWGVFSATRTQFFETFRRHFLMDGLSDNGTAF